MTELTVVFVIVAAVLLPLVGMIIAASPPRTPCQQPLARNRAGGRHESYTPTQQSIHKGSR